MHAVFIYKQAARSVWKLALRLLYVFYSVNVQQKLLAIRRPSYIHHASVLLGCLDSETGSDLLTGDDLTKTNVKY